MSQMNRDESRLRAGANAIAAFSIALGLIAFLVLKQSGLTPLTLFIPEDLGISTVMSAPIFAVYFAAFWIARHSLPDKLKTACVVLISAAILAVYYFVLVPTF